MTIAFLCALIYYHFQQRHFKILRATSRKWISAKRGDVVTYRIQVKTKKTSDELKLDELWIDRKLYKVRVARQDDHTIAKYFSKQETLYIEAERETGNVCYEEMVPPGKGKVAIGYLINNQRKYLSIKGFEEHRNKLSLTGAQPG